MNLIIIGNGFDRAHDIPCSYYDFKCYLEANNELGIESLKTLYPRKKDDTLLLWSDFEEALAYPNRSWLREMDELLNEDANNDDWLTSMLDKMFVGWVRDISFYGITRLESQNPFSQYLNQDNAYLSFNYTDTLERVYGFYNVLHIHGCAVYNQEVTQDNIIYGHRHIKTNNKYIAMTEKKVDEIIKENRKWFNNVAKNIDGKIVVMGFSCSEVDEPYLLFLRSILPNNSWHFFYHSDKDKERIEYVTQLLKLSKNDYVIEYA